MGDKSDLKRFLQVLPYGDEGVFGFVGWKWCTPDPDPNVGRVRLVEDHILKEPVVEISCAPNLNNKNVYIQFPDEEKYTGIGAKFPIANFQLKNLGNNTGIQLRCKVKSGKMCGPSTSMTIYLFLSLTHTHSHSPQSHFRGPIIQ